MMPRNNKNVFGVDDRNEIDWKSQSLDTPQKSNKFAIIIISFILLIMVLIIAIFYISLNKFSDFTTEKIPEIITSIEEESDWELDYIPIQDITIEDNKKSDDIITNNDIFTEHPNNKTTDNIYVENIPEGCNPEINLYCFFKEDKLEVSNPTNEFLTSWIDKNPEWGKNEDSIFSFGYMGYTLEEISNSDSYELYSNYTNREMNGNGIVIIDINNESHTITAISDKEYEKNNFNANKAILHVSPATTVKNEINIGDKIDFNGMIQRATNYEIHIYVTYLESQN